MSSKLDLFDLSLEELKQVMSRFGEPNYRANQIWNWLYQGLRADIGQMTNLPLAFRDTFSDEIDISIAEPIELQSSEDKQTTKALFQLADNNLIETVLMKYDKRRTLCISTQAGCAMGCVFCATGQMGFSRNLTTGEIIRQVIYFAQGLATSNEKVTNIVFMGMGEPLHNYQNTLKALDILTDENGLNIGARKITLSTVGLVPAMKRYADEKRQTPLAVSLHAATDSERQKLIPVAKRWSLSELIGMCRYYTEQTGRRITFEWALIDNVNDTLAQARILGNLVEGLLCHVNLIPLNPTTEYGGRSPSRQRVAAFQNELSKYGISSTVRVRRGIDIQAGCGQLRARSINS